jgi:hypothetical protein
VALARLRASIVALSIFHTFGDDVTAEECFKELDEIEKRVARLCERIS